MEGSNGHKKLAWQVSVPIFRNTVILKQLGIAIGIPFGLLAVILLIINRDSNSLRYTFILLGLLMLLTWLFILVVYRGKYEVGFELNDRDVCCRTLAKQVKKNNLINLLTVVFGLISGKAAVAGAGMLAHSKQASCIKWNRIKKVTYKPNSFTIMLRGGWMESLALFCTQENYPLVEQFVIDKTKIQPRDSRY